ncbi:type II secretion system protein [Ornithinibacillus halotolerans]|uniref:Prepilin-type N-terminal cleavage/methylation domain-containing protein n=1 Tax=Ornithinibacillus halotolerans TaxID=1274357 RepID=A0A916RSM1_9BACI|nr:prepilin-type N-terminal cleavage/methylation domain-containing protein [Ornithinibacillus halotolerans]GGA68319.1 hypothetical protein GCM10008025_10370 [Ornithinibacillus halotolerans]
MKNNRGFTVIEVIVSLTIFLLLCTLLIPLVTHISFEREVLSERRAVTYVLHDEMQSKVVPSSFQREIDSISVTFTFNRFEDSLIIGCATWLNIMQRKEEVCLYGWEE